MSVAVVLFITLIVTFVIVSHLIASRFEKRAKKHINERFDVYRIFEYAVWTRRFELISFGILALSALILIIADEPRAVYLGALALFLLLLCIRPFQWEYTYIKLDHHRLIYKTGKWVKKKKIINLYNVKHVWIENLMCIIKMTDGSIIRLPLGFQKQDYLYAILKYYRPENRKTTSTRKANT